MPKSKKLRCHHCKKKIGIVHITCDCTNKYCFKCSYPHIHNCEFQKKRIELNKKRLEEENQVIVNKQVLEI